MNLLKSTVEGTLTGVVTTASVSVNTYHHKRAASWQPRAAVAIYLVFLHPGSVQHYRLEITEGRVAPGETQSLLMPPNEIASIHLVEYQ